jgi:hypothetical protein
MCTVHLAEFVSDVVMIITCFVEARVQGEREVYMYNNISERQEDIMSIIQSLDISPTLYANAVEKYQALGHFLNDNGLEAEIYPQGSFAFGTVVRPSTKDSSARYDLDFICQVAEIRDRKDFTPEDLRNKVERVLKSNKTYADRLKIYNTCFTIEYADVGDIGFSIDIVPAIPETDVIKQRLMKKSINPYLIDTAISIPKYIGKQRYKWITNNPKGLRKWFDDINEPFLAIAKESERIRLFEKYNVIYESVEEIPDELERSALQRVIQILKCHRNKYYASIEDGTEIKPISAIINVVVAQIAKKFKYDCSIFELLKYVLSEFSIYGEYQRIAENEFVQKYDGRKVISRPEGKWYIENPANPEDNLADQWNSDARIPNKFFKWIEVAQSDLINSLENCDNNQFRLMLESGFGSTNVVDSLGEKYSGDVVLRDIDSRTAGRPYSVSDD